jgi:glutamate-1-semialdehyde aminotransferase
VSGLDRSRAWWSRAEAVIPLGTQTLSKSPTQFVQGVSPIFLERGRGAHVWDVDGNEYVDFPMALGPVLLGYADPRVDAAVRAQLDSGITFTLMHPLEVEVVRQVGLRCCFGGRTRRPSSHGPRPRRHPRVPRMARLVHRVDDPLDRCPDGGA